MKRSLIVSGVAILLLLIVASIVTAYRQPSALDVARGQCAERGINANDLALLGYRSAGWLIGASETVEFQVQGVAPARKVVVDLRKPIYFLPWQVVDFRDAGQKK